MLAMQVLTLLDSRRRKLRDSRIFILRVYAHIRFERIKYFGLIY
jgi:hypothetical protein